MEIVWDGTELSWDARNLRVQQPMACRGMPGDQKRRGREKALRS
jgi:hypothetical protein